MNAPICDHLAMHRRLYPLALGALLGFLLLVPTMAAAASQTRYVSTAGIDSSGEEVNDCLLKAQPCLSIQHAIDEANGGDTVSVKSGKYTEADQVRKPLTIIGESSGATVEAGIDDPTFLVAADVTLRNLRIVGGEAAVVGEVGEDNPSPAVKIVSSTLSVATAGSDAIYVEPGLAATVAKSTITAGPNAKAAIVETGGTVAVEDSTVTGPEGIRANAGHVSLARDSIEASGIGVVQVESAVVTIRDSLVAPRPGGTLTYGVGVANSGGGSLTMIGSTVFATDAGTTTENSPSALATATESGTIKITVIDSILRALAKTVPASAKDISNLNSGTITWSIAHSSFTSSAGTGIPAAGSGTNVAAAPSFADLATGDYHPTGAAPALIDAGDPGQVTTNETDLGGGPRAIDGNCDSVAQPDIGAYEFVRTAPCPPPAKGDDSSGGAGGGKSPGPMITGVSVKHSGGVETLHFTLSEPAKVKITIELAHTAHGKKRTTYATLGTIHFNAKKMGAQSVPLDLHGAKLIAGAYRVAIVASDSAGQSSAQHRKSFVVARD